MIKEQEIKDPGSCLNRALPAEPIFVLLGRDLAAPAAIRDWAAKRIQLGKNQAGDDQITEALDLADEMLQWREKMDRPPATIPEPWPATEKKKLTEITLGSAKKPVISIDEAGELWVDPTLDTRKLLALLCCILTPKSRP